MNTDIIIGTALGTLTTATPLLLAAQGETIVQKAGLVNVGLEGMMLLGAFAATIATQRASEPIIKAHLYGLPPAYAGLVAAGAAGGLLALLFAAFAVRLVANQVVIGVSVSLLALGLTGAIYRRLFGATGAFVQTEALPRLLWGQNALTLLALAAAPALWWWLSRTRRGLELRACGEQPVAAEAAGVSVRAVRMRAALFGGLMAGLAGAFLSLTGEHGSFVPNMTGGRGFIALAIVTAGRWNAWGVLIAGMLFGFTEVLQFQGQALGLKNIPYQLLLALPYLITLVALSLGGRSTQAPAALGRPYRKA